MRTIPPAVEPAMMAVRWLEEVALDCWGIVLGIMVWVCGEGDMGKGVWLGDEMYEYLGDGVLCLKVVVQMRTMMLWMMW